MTSTIDYGVIQDTDKTDYEIIQKDRELEEQWKMKNEEIAKRRAREDKDENYRAYRYSHFFCGKTVIPKKYEAAIIEHKSTCPKCSSEIAEKAAQKQAWVDALAEMRGILSNLEECKETIEIQKRKIQRETKDKLQGWDTVVETAKAKIKETQNLFEREQIHKHKMLNPDLNNLNNETITRALNDMYVQYTRLTPQQKKHFENHISYAPFSD